MRKVRMKASRSDCQLGTDTLPSLGWPQCLKNHYSNVIMSVMASQITSLTIIFSTVYSGADQRKHQSSASLAFVRGIHRWPVNSPHKGQWHRKCFHLIMQCHHDYTYGSSFAAFCCGYTPVNFAHTLQGYFTGTGSITFAPYQCSNRHWSWKFNPASQNYSG